MKTVLLWALPVVAWSAIASAAPNPWPFDFDRAVAEDPQGIDDGLSELGQGLVGMPTDRVVEVTLDDVRLYLFDDIAPALRRAVDAGPGIEPAVSRDPVTCELHASFSVPPLTAGATTAACDRAERAIAEAFVGADDTCFEVEFPETYVFRHPPGQVETDTVQSFEGLIALAGEAVTHIDFPSGLIPPEFMPAARSVIAKLRYEPLKRALEARQAAYRGALARLADDADCFDPVVRASFASSVEVLVAELTSAEAMLDALYETGLEEADRDRRIATRMCRVRGELSHPALTDRERELLAFYVGGVYWRMRGAGLIAYPPDPGQGLLRRILYVKYPYQEIADLTGGAGGEGVGDPILFDENWGWAEWWDMGHSPGSADKYSDLVNMTKRGKRGVNVLEPKLRERGFDTRALVAGAMQMGPCYYYAWERLEGFRLGEDLEDPYLWFIEWPGSLGEFCAGATLGTGLARTLLFGTPDPDPTCVPCVGDACLEDDGNGNGDGGGDGDGDTGDGTGEGDDSGPGSETPPGNGGCSAASGGAGLSLLGLFAVAGLGWRRRRRT